jgi:hypothetical protein
VPHPARKNEWVKSPHCSIVIEAHNIERLLRYLGEPPEPPKRAPARDLPYFKSQVLRGKFGELD